MEDKNSDTQAPNPGTSDGGKSTLSTSINAASIFKVGVKVPPFWAEEPEIWFAQVEGQFAISGVTNDTTKFNYIIGHLDNQYSREIKDIIINPPATNKYQKLKTELVKRLSDTKEKKAKQLLMHEELGDRKPSQFLRHLKGLAGSSVTDEFMKTIWISRLPVNIQTVLAGQPAATSLDDLSDLADRVHDIIPPAPKIAAVSDGVPSSIINELAHEISELRKQFQNLSEGRSSRSRTPASRSKRSPSRQRSQSNYRKYPVCWYHSKFGEKAGKCIRPCDYKAENPRGSR